MTNIAKFPYSASRRLYSRRPRKSINGTPEERAARAGAAAAELTSATVTKIAGRSGDNQVAKAATAAPSIVEFAQTLRAYFQQELARGLTIDRIFDDLEETWKRAENARRKP